MVTTARAIHWLLAPSAAVALMGSIFAGTAHAGLSDYLINVQPIATQNSDNAPTAFNTYLFTSVLFEQNATDFTGASLGYPGPGSPASFGPWGPNEAFFQSSASSLATFQNNFPFGTYTATATNTTTMSSQSASINYTANYIPVIPALTGTTYNQLQGVNPSVAFDATFNSFVPNPNTPGALIELNFFNQTTGALTAGFDPSIGSTSFIIPANTLAPDTSYTFALLFDNYIQATSGTVPTQLSFIGSTFGSFTTGPANVAPAPSIEHGLPVLLAVGGILFGAKLLEWRKRIRVPTRADASRPFVTVSAGTPAGRFQPISRT